MTDRPDRSLFERAILKSAIGASFAKLDPRLVARNPVMFVVEVGALLSTLVWIVQAFGGSPPGGVATQARSTWAASGEPSSGRATGADPAHGEGDKRAPVGP